VVDGVYRRPDGVIIDTRRITLDALGLDPLDVVYLAAAEPGGQSELEARLRDDLLRARPDGVAADAAIELRLDAADLPTGLIDGATLIELARALYRVIASSRPLADHDLLDVGESAGATTGDVADLRSRADAVVAAFSQAADGLAAAQATAPLASQLRAALYTVAAFGVPGSIPRVPEDAPDAVPVLTEQASFVAEVLRARLEELQALIDPDPAGDEIAHHTRRLQIVLGPAFQVLVPFVPTHAEEIAAGFDSADTLLGGVPDAAEEFLSQTASVRPATAALQRMRDYAEVLDPARALPLAAAQLPFTGAETRWGALPGAPAGNGTVALLAAQTARHDFTRPLTGLLVDAWDEVVPADTQTTGLAFNFNAPDSEPPNVILLAAPANPSGQWSTDELLDAVNEVLQAVPARASDRGLSRFGHFLPATFFAFNLQNHTVSTDFTSHLR